ncbi:hypothetical protein HTG_11010 [Natrinema mahii]|nr:hypothetical protein HTG_11010 [Natrinema mahii]
MSVARTVPFSAVSVVRDAASDTVRWECNADHCDTVGFTARRRTRLGLETYRERYQDAHR